MNCQKQCNVVYYAYTMRHALGKYIEVAVVNYTDKFKTGIYKNMFPWLDPLNTGDTFDTHLRRIRKLSGPALFSELDSGYISNIMPVMGAYLESYIVSFLLSFNRKYGPEMSEMKPVAYANNHMSQ